MDLKEIREMSDAELEKFLKSLKIRHNSNCVKCNKPNSNYVMNIQSKKKLQQKKLCCLCESCYSDLLDYLGTADIMWE